MNVGIQKYFAQEEDATSQVIAAIEVAQPDRLDKGFVQGSTRVVDIHSIGVVANRLNAFVGWDFHVSQDSSDLFGDGEIRRVVVVIHVELQHSSEDIGVCLVQPP